MKNLLKKSNKWMSKMIIVRCLSFLQSHCRESHWSIRFAFLLIFERVVNIWWRLSKKLSNCRYWICQLHAQRRLLSKSIVSMGFVAGWSQSPTIFLWNVIWSWFWMNKSHWNITWMYAFRVREPITWAWEWTKILSQKKID